MKTFTWPNNIVANQSPTTRLVDEFEQALNEAQDERPLQRILASNPILISSLLPPAMQIWCFDRPKFGSELIPDFLLCYYNSAGFNWTMVEIESPTKKPLNSNGRMSAGLTEAIGQVQDWRIWLRQNVAYASQQLGFSQLNAECRAVVIIGRRHHINQKHALNYRELSDQQTEVMSYDRLIELNRSIIR